MAKQKLIKGRYLNIVLLALAFLMTIVITFTVTVAWFFDSDWASNDITMGGKVSIYLTNGVKDGEGNYTQLYGKNQLHFKLFDSGDPTAPGYQKPVGYPGQTIDVRASVFNDGDSKCYVRAKFLVASNVPDSKLSLSSLYIYLQQLVNAINSNSSYQYCWRYYEQTAANAIKFDGSYYLNGTAYTDSAWNTLENKSDGGYYYLCKKVSNAVSDILMPMELGELDTFFMDGTFLIPWQLKNDSAGCKLFAAVQFDAIQTYIPIVYNKDAASGTKEYTSDPTLHGTICKDVNNQMPEDLVKYNTYSAQAVWNSCEFDGITESWVDSGFSIQDKPSS